MKKFIDEIVEVFKKYYFLLFCTFSLALPNKLVLEMVTPGVFSETYVNHAQLFFCIGWISLIIFLCVVILPKKCITSMLKLVLI